MGRVRRKRRSAPATAVVVGHRRLSSVKAFSRFSFVNDFSRKLPPEIGNFLKTLTFVCLLIRPSGWKA
jgi:hypothetical protein